MAWGLDLVAYFLCPLTMMVEIYSALKMGKIFNKEISHKHKPYSNRTIRGHSQRTSPKWRGEGVCQKVTRSDIRGEGVIKK